VPLAQQQHSQQEHDAAEEQQQLAALLLVGSRCSSSQTLGIPQSLWDAITSNRLDALQQQDHQQAPWVLPVVQSALLPSIAGAQSVAVYKDPSGAL
jgi:hypothetical protein